MSDVAAAVDPPLDPSALDPPLGSVINISIKRLYRADFISSKRNWSIFSETANLLLSH